MANLDIPPVDSAYFADQSIVRPWALRATFDRYDESMPRVSGHWRHEDFLSLYIVRQGRGTHVINGTPYSVARGDVYAMAEGMSHFFVGCENFFSYTFHFQPEIVTPAQWDTLKGVGGFSSLFVPELHENEAGYRPARGHWLHLTPPQFEQVAAAVEELRAEWTGNGVESELLVPGLFLRLLITLARYNAPVLPSKVEGAPESRNTRGIERHADTVAAAVRFLDEHYAEPVRLEKLAGSFYLSADRFCDVFGAIMGRTPHDYLRHVRLEAAKKLLQNGDVPVNEVAHLTGFGNPAYFTRAFRQATGVPPREFRRRLKLASS